MDMIFGYNQIPVFENSRRFTAFITFLGVFQPLGPLDFMGTPAYFQNLSIPVLSDLMYTTVKLYIDDIIIHAQSC